MKCILGRLFVFLCLHYESLRLNMNITNLSRVNEWDGTGYILERVWGRKAIGIVID